MDAVRHDLIGGYITAEKAEQIYGLDKEEIVAILADANAVDI